MGLPLTILRFLAREHRREPFTGSVLTLGRQCVYATYEELREMLQREGIPAADLPAGVPRGTNLPQWRGQPEERFTSDEVFFRLLGLAGSQALDVSDFEGAELIADLNLPVDEALCNRFDLIVDSGTLEHLFHLPQALANLGQMLRTGGRVIHISPANNWTNHGFYQFSPTLFADYYHHNRYGQVRVYLAEQASHRDIRSPLRVYELEDQQPELMMSCRRLFSIAVATKELHSTVGQIPLQGYYAAQFEVGHGEAARPAAARGLAAWKARIPIPLKTAVRRWIPGRDPLRRPWGLRFWGRLE
jgi:SAM-dependent methyltransferase